MEFSFGCLKSLGMTKGEPRWPRPLAATVCGGGVAPECFWGKQGTTADALSQVSQVSTDDIEQWCSVYECLLLVYGLRIKKISQYSIVSAKFSYFQFSNI